MAYFFSLSCTKWTAQIGLCYIISRTRTSTLLIRYSNKKNNAQPIVCTSKRKVRRCFARFKCFQDSEPCEMIYQRLICCSFGNFAVKNLPRTGLRMPERRVEAAREQPAQEQPAREQPIQTRVIRTTTLHGYWVSPPETRAAPFSLVAIGRGFCLSSSLYLSVLYIRNYSL